LVAIAKSDSQLRAYDVVVVDEAHQHTVATDLLLGLLKQLTTTRSDLKIVVMSATIDTEQFKAFFPGSVVHDVSGRAFPVKHKYLQQPVLQLDMVDAVVRTIMQAHLVERSGDILVFVAGVLHITRIIRKIEAIMNGDPNTNTVSMYDPEDVGELHCYPLFSEQSQGEQNKTIQSVAPPNRSGKHSRKVIVATNIAETSVTLPGVTIVIDSLLSKVRVVNPESESNGLFMMWVSQSVAKQRSGRAGRVRPGTCYRMCTYDGFHSGLAKHTVPDILNCDMVEECLSILQMGLNPINFPYMSAPATETIVKALGVLLSIGAIQFESRLTITPRGEAYSRLPVDLASALMIFESTRFNCQDEILAIVAMMSATNNGTNLFIKSQSKEDQASIKETRIDFGLNCGDHIMLLNIYLAWRDACISQTSGQFLIAKLLNGNALRAADEVRLNLLTHLVGKNDRKGACADLWAETAGNTPRDDPCYYTQVLSALAAGNFMRVAKRVPGPGNTEPRSDAWETVRTAHHATPAREGCCPSPGSDWIIYNEFSTASHNELRLITPIPLDVMIEAFPTAWCEYNLTGYGHVSTSIVETLMRMTNCTEDFVRRAMLANPHQREEPTTTEPAVPSTPSEPTNTTH